MLCVVKFSIVMRCISLAVRRCGDYDCRDLSEFIDLSKLREVLECCEGVERHEMSVCRKVFNRHEVYFLSSQTQWGL